MTYSLVRCSNGDGMHKRSRRVKVSEEKWCLLPNLVIWMIKDKLDIFDCVRLTCVCRDWRLASAGYLKQSIGDGSQWIMQCPGRISTTVRDFISVQRNIKFSINLPEFFSAKFLFSRQGWILLCQFRCPSRGRMLDTFVLVNPFRKATIKMPNLDESRSSSCYGCFSIRAGYPEYVVLLLIDHTCDGLIVRTACPGDQVWTVHSYIPMSLKFRSGKGLLTIEQNIYCFDTLGNMIVYSMSSQLWKEVPIFCTLRFAGHIAELEGHLLRLDQHSRKIFRFNDNNNSWEELRNSEMKDMSWIVSRSESCYVARTPGLKAYTLTRNFYHHLRQNTPSSTCEVHDMVDGKGEMLHLRYALNCSASWVDIS